MKSTSSSVWATNFFIEKYMFTLDSEENVTKHKTNKKSEKVKSKNPGEKWS